MSDSEQCSNRLEFDLISLLVNFSRELGANNDQIWLPMGSVGRVLEYDAGVPGSIPSVKIKLYDKFTKL